MTIAVTGGAGYIGAHVVRMLREQGEEVVVIDDLSSGAAARIGDAHLVELDVTGPDATTRLRDVLRSAHATSVIHFAAKKRVDESVRRPAWYFAQNVGGLATVLEAMEQAHVGRMVFSSSAAVYGMPDVERVTEDQPLAPMNPYGESKVVGEWLVRDAGAAWGLRSTSLRYFNVAGSVAPELGDPGILNLVTMVLDRLSRGEAPVIFGDDYPTPDGTCIRDFVHVQDLAVAHVLAMRDLDEATGPLTQTFNVGTGQGVSVREVVEAIRAASGDPTPPVVAGRRPGDPARVVADAGRIEAQLGWRAVRDLDEIIGSAWRAWQQRQSAR